MTRLLMSVEGKTEIAFVKRNLMPFLSDFEVYPEPIALETGKKRGVTFRGGMLNYQKTKNEIILLIKSQRKHPDVWITTFYDLYKLPNDFPGYIAASQYADPLERTARLEEVLKQEIEAATGFDRFIPYIQCHEFEALLFSDLEKLDKRYSKHHVAIKGLVKACKKFPSPEHINGGPDTAPSKRLEKSIPDYKKVRDGTALIADIGLTHIRAQCRRFDQWLTTLESLGKPTA